MSEMFEGCTSLENLNLSNLDTSNVTNMSSMFRDCTSLENLNLSSLDTSNVTGMSEMFEGCTSLENLNLSSLDTSNVTHMGGMFFGCTSLQSLNLNNLDTSNVTYMTSMFRGCASLESLDLSNLDTSNVTYMDSMFEDCASLESLGLNNLDTSNVTYMGWMFRGCTSLRSLDLSNLDTSNVIDMRWMFLGCTSLNSIDISSFDTSRVTDEYDPKYLFNECFSLQKIIVGSKLTFEIEFPYGKWCNSKNEEVNSSFIPCGVADTYTVIIGDSQITISETAKVVNVGDSPFTLVAAVTPADSFNGAIAWSSTNTNVATVDADGRVTPVGVGTTMIVASAGSMTAQCSLTVVASDDDIIPVESVAIDRSTALLSGKDTVQLSATAYPEDATYRAIRWTSSNPNIASVSSDGLVESTGKGEAVITASSLDGKESASCQVTVLNPPTSVHFSNFPSQLKIGESVTFDLVGSGELPGETEELTLPVWNNSDSSIASLSIDGLSATLTGLSTGTTAITGDAKYGENRIRTTENVEVVWADPESVSISESSKSTIVGAESFTLTSTVYPESASGYQVLWSSSDPDVASVDQSGVVEIHKSGYAVITARAGAVFANCEVNVDAKSLPVSPDSDLKGYVLINDSELVEELSGLRLKITNNEDKSKDSVKSAALASLASGSTLADLYDVSFVDNDDNEHPWTGSSKAIAVYIEMTDELKELSESNDLVIHYLSDDLSARETKNTWVEGNNLVFETNHFSTYAVTSSPKSSDPSGQPSGGSGVMPNGTNVSGDPKALAQTGDDRNVALIPLAVSAVLAVVAALCFVAYRRRRAAR